MPRMRCIVDGPDADSKLLLLDESIPAGRLDGLPAAVRNGISQAGYAVQQHSVPMGYEQLSFAAVLRVRPELLGISNCIARCRSVQPCDTGIAKISSRRERDGVCTMHCGRLAVHSTTRDGCISCAVGVIKTGLALQKLLPEAVEVPAAFEAVGHIAHFNLREEQLPYRHLIGQARGSLLRSALNPVAPRAPYTQARAGAGMRRACGARRPVKTGLLCMPAILHSAWRCLQAAAMHVCHTAPRGCRCALTRMPASRPPCTRAARLTTSSESSVWRCWQVRTIAVCGCAIM